MKLLLTSAGVKNPSIQDALVSLLGKPIAESSALCIPTAAYGHPQAGPHEAWKFISGEQHLTPMTELGWESMGVLELTALPSIDEELWVPMIGEDFIGWKPPSGREDTLGLVDFAMFPHLDNEKLPENTMADAERWAANMPVPGYAIDDQTDGTAEVVSEGNWKLFTP